MLKLYSVTDSPPSTAVRMALKYLQVEYELINIDLDNGQHHSPDFLKLNPVGQIPVLVDGNFVLCESVAILQYLAIKFKRDEAFYPENLQKRAFVTQLLCFHLSILSPAIGNYFILPMLCGTEPSENNLKQLTKALVGFEGILSKQNSTYAAGNEVTIADVALSTAILCCDCNGEYDFGNFPRVQEWYEEFQKTEIWIVGKECRDELAKYSISSKK